MPDHSGEGVRWSIIVAGAALALAIAAATLQFATPRAARPGQVDPATAADSLIGLWIDSVGGMQAYDRFHSATFTVSTVLYDTLSGRVKRDRPRYVWIRKGPQGEETRVERWETTGFIEQGFNGVVSWARRDGATLPDTARDVREARYVAQELFYWMGLPYKLRDAGVILTYRGMTSRPGAEFRESSHEPATHPPDDAYHAVDVSFEAGVGEQQDEFTYYFLPGEGFPVEVTYVEEGGGETHRVLWGATVRAGGRYPYMIERRWMTGSGLRRMALRITDLIVNPDIPQSAFDPPEG